MQLTNDYLKSVKPETSDPKEKYSWSLYRFLRQKNVRNSIHVYKGISGQYGNNIPEYFFAVTICGNGEKGADNIGIFQHQLRNTPKTGKLNMMSYDNYDFSKWEDVTNTFFKEYQEKGKCVFDHPNHQWDLTINNVNRFETINGKTRRCKWCGKTFHLKKILVEEQIWVED